MDHGEVPVGALAEPGTGMDMQAGCFQWNSCALLVRTESTVSAFPAASFKRWADHLCGRQHSFCDL